MLTVFRTEPEENKPQEKKRSLLLDPSSNIQIGSTKVERALFAQIPSPGVQVYSLRNFPHPFSPLLPNSLLSSPILINSLGAGPEVTAQRRGPAWPKTCLTPRSRRFPRSGQMSRHEFGSPRRVSEHPGASLPFQLPASAVPGRQGQSRPLSRHERS